MRGRLFDWVGSAFEGFSDHICQFSAIATDCTGTCLGNSDNQTPCLDRKDTDGADQYNSKPNTKPHEGNGWMAQQEHYEPIEE